MGMFDLLEQAEKIAPMMEQFAEQYAKLCKDVATLAETQFKLAETQQKLLIVQIRVDTKLDALLNLHGITLPTDTGAKALEKAN